jgi:hypothetical protein
VAARKKKAEEEAKFANAEEMAAAKETARAPASVLILLW